MNTLSHCTDRIGLANEDLPDAANDTNAQERAGLFDRMFVAWSERAYRNWLSTHPKSADGLLRDPSI